MANVSIKREVNIPYYQVFGQKRGALKRVKRAQKMTNQLHVKKQEKLICNDGKETKSL